MDKIFIVISPSEIIFNQVDDVAWAKSPLIVEEHYQTDDYPVFLHNNTLHRQPTCIDDIPTGAIAVIPCICVEIPGEDKEYIRKPVNIKEAMNYEDWMVRCQEEYADGFVPAPKRDEFDLFEPSKTYYRYISLQRLIDAGLREFA